MKQFSVFVAVFLTTISSYSQDAEWRNFNTRRHSLALNFGLIQPLVLKGANIEADYRYSHFIASYSHGWGLELSGKTIVGEEKVQNLSVQVPYTTGFGIGGSYGITKANLLLDIRLETKFHRYEVSYGTDNNTVQHGVTAYNTFTLGGGLYISYLPFARSERLAKGINLSMSFRYWPMLFSSLDGNNVVYFNRYTNQNEVHRARAIGIANTPFIFNISIGYLFK